MLSDNNWAVCLTKVTFSQFVEILKMSSCDQAYKYVPLNYGKKLWTIRLSEKNNNKPKFLTKLILCGKQGKYYDNECSLAHFELLSKFYKKDFEGNDWIGLDKFDNNEQLIVSSYGAEKGGE